MIADFSKTRLIAAQTRARLVQLSHQSGAPHLGSSLSCVDILVAAYWHCLRIDPSHPKWPDRDRFILSKGHAAPALYSVMAECGYCPQDQLNTLRKLGSIYQGHPDVRFLPSLDASTGSLGEGISIGIGMALAAKLDNSPARVYVVLGDGETQEGQIWESAMFAGDKGVDNLVCITDNNRIQLDGFVKDIMPLDPLADKWRAFNWHTIEVD